MRLTISNLYLIGFFASQGNHLTIMLFGVNNSIFGVFLSMLPWSPASYFLNSLNFQSQIVLLEPPNYGGLSLIRKLETQLDKCWIIPVIKCDCKVRIILRAIPKRSFEDAGSKDIFIALPMWPFRATIWIKSQWVC